MTTHGGGDELVIDVGSRGNGFLWVAGWASGLAIGGHTSWEEPDLPSTVQDTFVVIYP